ncbi:hypothetical protein [Hymenobacter cellulosivorans]|uniref:Uncharacterized protein n=1 Tax=Hymenobacter cellulosivorans TaxID=2932249 RepID=A0ABY4F558_9BACT|nr:hypothetical protein [Hymenobacter cellulosivorans]UOQ51604.1 hypothetical protein MUN80_17795 [Hymenobacter cellulosivorans]
MNKFIGVLALLLSVVGYWSLGQTPEVSQQEAIRVAEAFVQDNGYTSKPARSATLHYELLDAYAKDAGTILKARSNTLHPNAFCIAEDPESWHVGFLLTRVSFSTLSAGQKQADLAGRVVMVNKRDKTVKMAHKDPLFSHFKKL